MTAREGLASSSGSGRSDASRGAEGRREGGRPGGGRAEGGARSPGGGCEGQRGGAGVYNPVSWGNTRVFSTFNILMCIMSLQEGHIQCSVSYIYLTKQLILEVHLAVLVFHKAHFEICHL